MDPVVAIVCRALCAVAEGVVGGGDLCEAGGGAGVVRVAVWVVAEGEGVEFPLIPAG